VNKIAESEATPVRTVGDQTEKNRKKKERKRLRLLQSEGLLPVEASLVGSLDTPVVQQVSRLPSSNEYGSHFTKRRKTVINDEWQTTQEAWAQVTPCLNRFRNSSIWMPFYYDGKCGEYLKALGFPKVVHSNTDFFERARDKAFVDSVDLVLDNPPYTGAELKTKILTTLVQLKKPFILLLPSSVLFSKLFRETLSSELVQLIIPTRVAVRKTGDEAVPFKYLIWLCYGVQLPKDLMWV
jgi:hypothetical protein